MKKLLKTILYDLLFILIIISIFFFFVSYFNIENYITNNYLNLFFKEYGIKTNQKNINYVFPFKLEFNNVLIGTNSIIKKAGVSISPISLLSGDNIKFYNIDVDSAILYKNDFNFLIVKNNGKKRKIKIDVSNINIKDSYIIIKNRKNNFKIENMEASLNTEKNKTFFEINNSKFEYKNREFGIDKGLVEKNNNNYKLNLFYGDNILNYKIDGKINEDKLNLQLVSNSFPLKFINRNFMGKLAGRGVITGDIRSPVFKGNINTKNVQYKNIKVNNSRYNVTFSPEYADVKNINLLWKNGILEGNLYFDFRRQKNFKGDFIFKNINITELIEGIDYKSSLNGNLRIDGYGNNWENFKGSVSLQNLNGKLSNERIKNGKLNFNKEKSLYEIKKAYAEVGKGKVEFDGYYLNKSYSLKLNLDKINLGKIYNKKEISGTMDFKGIIDKSKKEGLSFIGYLKGEDISYQNYFKIDHFTSHVSYENQIKANFLFSKMKLFNSDFFKSGKIKINYDYEKGIFHSYDTEFYINEENKITFNFKAEKNEKYWVVNKFNNKFSIKNDKYLFLIDKIKTNRDLFKMDNFVIKGDDDNFNLNLETGYSFKKLKFDIKSDLKLDNFANYFSFINDLQGDLSFEMFYDSISSENIESKIKVSIPKLQANTFQLNTVEYNNLYINAEYTDNKGYKLDNTSFFVDNVKNSIKGMINFDINDKYLKLEESTVNIFFNKMYSSFLVNPFTDSVSVVSGYFKGPFKLKYKDTLLIDADVEVFDTDLAVYQFGNLYLSKVHGDASLQNNKLTIDKFIGFSENNRKVEFYGYLLDIFSNNTQKFTISFDKVYFPEFSYYSGLVDGKINLIRKNKISKIEGELFLPNGVVNESVDRLLKAGGSGYPVDKSLNLHITSDKGLWLKNENADIEFEADMYYRNDHGSDKIYLGGSLEAIKGNLNYLTVPFKIQKGVINFPNTEGGDITVDILAKSSVFYEGENTIFLSIVGNADSPDVNLYSDNPNLNQNDIVSLLLFNYTYDELQNENFIGEKAGELATHFLQKEITQPIKSSIDLDILNVRGNLLTEEDRYLDVEIGKYLQEDFYMLYKDEYIKSERRSLNLIYYFNNNISIESGAVEKEGDLKYNIDLKFKYKY